MEYSFPLQYVFLGDVLCHAFLSISFKHRGIIFHLGIVWMIILHTHNVSVSLRCMFLFFQSAVNKAVNIILSVAKNIPLWKFAYLHHKQQQVSILF